MMVAYLDLFNTDVSGTIPKFYAMTQLRLGNMFKKSGISGTLPLLAEVGQKAYTLKSFIVKNTLVSGILPSDMTTTPVVSLEIYDVSFNDLTGSIPNAFPGFLKEM